MGGRPGATMISAERTLDHETASEQKGNKCLMEEGPSPGHSGSLFDQVHSLEGIKEWAQRKKVRKPLLNVEGPSEGG